MAVIKPADLAQDAHPQKVDGEDLGPEPLQLVGALIGQDDADQKGEQAHDRKRADAHFFDLADHGRKAKIASGQQMHAEPFGRNQADIARDAKPLVGRTDGGAPDPLGHREEGAARRHLNMVFHVLGFDMREQRHELRRNVECVEVLAGFQ